MDAPLYESSEIPSIIELNFHGDFPFLTYQMNVEVLSSTKVLLAEFTDKLPLAFVCLGVRVCAVVSPSSLSPLCVARRLARAIIIIMIMRLIIAAGVIIIRLILIATLTISP